ncbi:Aspartate/alanine antiporter [Vibrio aerogenes CECT 7868]|uniref:Aspartate/alanine antiporter n=1 Tax=Vibrio aerogenes CECT 7868 TaxID=1216006 RepID=A0A1M6A0E5_9VIBR|nr:putative transporter [Vibrio aerogenes]SHI29866.1 Aspartate/alanine antiporter [Vibrio aerogenes CECT 7868]
MGEIALSLLVLSVVAVVGLWLGGLKIKGVGLGIGGVLFGGILVGHIISQFGWHIDNHAMHFIKEFGLILFVYTIGIQVGPGFFASLKSSGLKLNGLAFGIVLLGGLTAVMLYFVFDLPLHVILGIFSGAVTNTPSLAAGQQVLQELGEATHQTDMLGLGYAMAYPFGILGILLSMWLIRIVFEISVDKEAEIYDSKSAGKVRNLLSVNILIENPNMNGMKFPELASLVGDDIVCSRVKTQGNLKVPGEDTILNVGDYLHFVGADPEKLHRAMVIIGSEVAESLSTKGTMLKSDRIVVTNEKVLGKHLGELDIKYQHNVVISRLNRAGVELVANRDSVLQFGDILYIIGQQSDIDDVGRMIGNKTSQLQNVQMLPIFIGIGLGVLLGSVPFQLPHLPAPLKLGLAGGPLIVAIILARIGSIGRLYWFMPPSANLALREIGIVLFLAVVGISCGGNFFTTILDGEGLTWMGLGVVITLVPLLTVGLLARLSGKLNYLTICGLMAGSMTDPPALAFANSIHATCGASALAYATVYPLVMCLRILTPQIIAVLLWTTGGG